ncbi:MAG: Fic family protein [Chitinophagales bacterium]|nr:Fic family protein [Chitinophagales bacterium]
MEGKEVKIWTGIDIEDNWLNTDTSKFDDLAPSWYKKRKEFIDGDSDYEEFLNRLKRQHAIETGIVEKLYDLSEGITQTLIKEGFVESYISHNDTNIAPKKLMQYLYDHFEAMDFVFDLVKSNRQLTVSFIKELHQLITQNQDYTEAIDTLGRIVQIPLLKGKFKENENNPKRKDGQIFIYCPTIHVESEMDKLIKIYNEQTEKELNPIILAAWVHHAFTQIHPFQDGNGRIARLLASLILIKNGLLPFTVKREDKSAYISALEHADKNVPQELVTFFSIEQKKSIENALNFKTEKTANSLADLANLLNSKVEKATSEQRKIREYELTENRNKVFEYIYDILGEIKEELKELIPREVARTGVTSVNPNQERHFWHTHQITEYANNHDYYFNRNMPRGWFGIHFSLPTESSYNLIITVHHYGYEDDVIAVGAFMEFSENIDEHEDKKLISINISPFTVSLERIGERTKDNLNSYIQDILKVGLTVIINEIN